MKKTSETDLVRATLTWLKLEYPQGIWWRANTGAFAGEYQGRRRFVRFGVPGMSDIQGVLPQRIREVTWGQAIFIECKTAKGKLSANQVAFQQAVEQAGAIYVVTREIGDIIL